MLDVACLLALVVRGHVRRGMHGHVYLPDLRRLGEPHEVGEHLHRVGGRRVHAVGGADGVGILLPLGVGKQIGRQVTVTDVARVGQLDIDQADKHIIFRRRDDLFKRDALARRDARRLAVLHERRRQRERRRVVAGALEQRAQLVARCGRDLRGGAIGKRPRDRVALRQRSQVDVAHAQLQLVRLPLGGIGAEDLAALKRGLDRVERHRLRGARGNMCHRDGHPAGLLEGHFAFAIDRRHTRVAGLPGDELGRIAVNRGGHLHRGPRALAVSRDNRPHIGGKLQIRPRIGEHRVAAVGV